MRKTTFFSVGKIFNERYFELVFKPGAGFLLGGSESGQIQGRLVKTYWSLSDQQNNYSFDPTFTEFAPAKKIELFYNDNMV